MKILNFCRGKSMLIELKRTCFIVIVWLTLVTQLVTIKIITSFQFIKFCNTVSYLLGVECGNLPEISNGFLSMTKSTFSGKVTYGCQSEYGLVGNHIRVCQANGSWSGYSPYCKLG